MDFQKSVQDAVAADYTVFGSTLRNRFDSQTVHRHRLSVLLQSVMLKAGAIFRVSSSTGIGVFGILQIFGN